MTHLIAKLGGAQTVYLNAGFRTVMRWSDSLNGKTRDERDPSDPPATFDSPGEAYAVLDTLTGKDRGAVVVSL